MPSYHLLSSSFTRSCGMYNLIMEVIDCTCNHGFKWEVRSSSRSLASSHTCVYSCIWFTSPEYYGIPSLLIFISGSNVVISPWFVYHLLCVLAIMARGSIGQCLKCMYTIEEEMGDLCTSVHSMQLQFNELTSQVFMVLEISVQ